MKEYHWTICNLKVLEIRNILQDLFYFSNITFAHIQKLTSKWTKDLNVRARTIKALEENKGQLFLNLGSGNGFWDMTTEIQAKKRINLTSSKWKAFPLQKISPNKWEDSPQWEKVFTSHIPCSPLFCSFSYTQSTGLTILNIPEINHSFKF